MYPGPFGHKASAFAPYLLVPQPALKPYNVTWLPHHTFLNSLDFSVCVHVCRHSVSMYRAAGYQRTNAFGALRVATKTSQMCVVRSRAARDRDQVT